MTTIFTNQASPGTLNQIQLNTEVVSPDSNGLIVIPVVNPDPTLGRVNNNDVRVTVTVATVEGNDLPIADMTMGAGFSDRAVATPVVSPAPVVAVRAPDEDFSDNDPGATSIDASTSAWRLLSPTRNRNSITVTVLDQYGDPFGDTSLSVVAIPSSRVEPSPRGPRREP